MTQIKPIQVLVALVLATAAWLPASAQYNPIEILSVSASGREGNGSSMSPNISSSTNGEIVVFSSDATDLVANDDDGFSDVFLVDRSGAQNAISRISRSVSGGEANGDSRNPVVSSDGKFVAFESDASNLVVGDNNEVTDIFVYDVDGETIERISVNLGGSDSDGASSNPSISNNGRYVAFQSFATNLVAGDDNMRSDIFRRDRTDDVTARVSIGFDINDNQFEADGNSQNAVINGDGSFIVFESDATNIVGDDGNGVSDIFLRTFTEPSVTLISRTPLGSPANGPSAQPSISNDGTIVVFQSSASDLVAGDDNEILDVFRYSIADEEITRVSNGRNGQEPNGPSFAASTNSDGSYVLFESSASNLVLRDENGVSDIFALEFSSGITTRLSVDSFNRELELSSSAASVNSNGQFVVFSSSSDKYVIGDDNQASDIFLLDTQCLLEPVGVTPQDQDSDSTNDCEDECPLDSAKILAGECGCGVPETDSDGDTTPDCIDGCPSDPNKAERGTCGCGVPDEDTNANQLTDCIEPTSEFEPRRPVVVYRKKSNLLRVIIPEEFPGYRYQIQIREGRTVITQKRTRRARARFRNLNLNGTIRIRYRILEAFGGGNSRFSKSRRVRTR